MAAARDPERWQIAREPAGLVLHARLPQGPVRLALSATGGGLATRLRTARRSDPLPRAIGLPKRQEPPDVIDATAGLCRDAALLAALGCRVTAVERLPALALLAHAAFAGAPFADRLTVVCGEAIAALRPAAAAVVYLDPMFAGGGRAQVKKEMQICRALAGPAEDVPELFAAARASARERVVVKRHPGEPPLAAGVSFAVAAVRVRFDVYLTG